MDSLDIEGSRPSSGAFFPVALSLAGILLGCVALYFAVNAQSKDVVSDFHGFDERLETLELRIEALSAENQTLKNGLSKVVEQTQTALGQVGREITAIYQHHAESRDAMGKLANGMRPADSKKAAPIAVPASNKTSTVQTASSKNSSNISTYKIQPGDTLAKLARRYSIPLQALLDANPGISPKSLRVGQSVAIPN